MAAVTVHCLTCGTKETRVLGPGFPTVPCLTCGGVMRPTKPTYGWVDFLFLVTCVFVVFDILFFGEGHRHLVIWPVLAGIFYLGCGD